MQIYNSKTRRKEEFVPIHPGEGRASMPAARRYTIIFISATPAPLSCSTCCAGIWSIAGYEVTFVQNFTDIDDKMITPRQRRGHHRQGAGRSLYRRVL